MDARKTQARTGIEVNFSTNKKPSANRLLNTMYDVESEFYLIFTIKYDSKNENHTKLIDHLLKNHVQEETDEYDRFEYRLGLLSNSQRCQKFNTEINYMILFDAYKFTHSDNGDSSLDISFPVPDTDFLLQSLSMIDDAIDFLKTNNVDIQFNITDIIINIINEYKKIKNDDCTSAKTLTNLIHIIKHNHMLEPHTAILLTYCFYQLEVCDPSLAFNPNDFNKVSSIISNVIDNVYKIKPIKEKDESKDKTNINSKKELIEKIEIAKYNGELAELISRLNICQRIQLYRPALHNTADDEGIYSWNYTEWSDFFKNVKFSLDNHDGVYLDVAECSKDIKSDYSKTYGENGANHDIFERELKAVAVFMGLSYQWDVKFHHKILFTNNCAKKLFDMKLYLDIDILKKLVKARNNYRFFEQATKTGDFHGYISEGKLLKELVEKIFSIKLGPICSPLQLDSPEYVSRVLGASRM